MNSFLNVVRHDFDRIIGDVSAAAHFTDRTLLADTVVGRAQDLFGQDDPIEMMNALLDTQSRISVGSFGAAEALIDHVAICYAPLVHPLSLAHQLGAFGHTQSEYDKWGRSKFASVDKIEQRESPLQMQVRKLQIPSKQAVGMDMGETHGYYHDESGWLYWDLTTLAELVALGGVDAPKRLYEEFNIAHPGRYPTTLLLGQLSTNAPKAGQYEVPVFVGRADENASLYEKSLYENLAAMAIWSRGKLLPTIYEVGSGTELIEAMSLAKRPAFGIINAHGIEGALNLGGDEYYDFDKGTNPAFTRLKKVWQGSGGLAILSCLAAAPYEDGNLIQSASDALGVPVIGSEDCINESKLLYRTNSDRTNTVSVRNGPNPFMTRIVLPKQGLASTKKPTYRLRASAPQRMATTMPAKRAARWDMQTDQRYV